KSLAVLRFSPSIVSAGVYTSDHQAFATYFRPGARLTPKLPPIAAEKSAVHDFQSGRIVVVVPIVSENKTVGTVYIESDLQALYARLARYGLMATGVLIICLIAARAGSS